MLGSLLMMADADTVVEPRRVTVRATAGCMGSDL